MDGCQSNTIVYTSLLVHFFHSVKKYARSGREKKRKRILAKSNRKCWILVDVPRHAKERLLIFLSDITFINTRLKSQSG